jgi:pantoate--beta-alanine ligase
MLVAKTISHMRRALDNTKCPLGLVPTMGALHEGHLALVRKARSENATLAVTIFVNSTQFASHEDFATYPRNLERDLTILEAEGADVVFVPSNEEMYPPGFGTFVDVGRIGQILEGQFRAGHFLGVATVVLKLLNICRPDRAYFGQKDSQQCMVLRSMVEDLNLEVELMTVPTVRESDGLALSSRNACLGVEERRAARVVSQALFAAKAMWESGVKNADLLKRQTRDILARESLVAQIDYVSIADARTIEELEVVEGKAILSTAVKIGSTRLIDNVILEPQELL